MDESSKIEKVMGRIWKAKDPVDKQDYFDEEIKNLEKKRLLDAAGLGTPCYALDADALRVRAASFVSTFKKKIPGAEFFYAFKCNDLPAQIKILKGLGFHADVAGLFELKLALKMGFGKILFTSPHKSDEELKLATENRTKVILDIDRTDELLRLISMKIPMDISIRIRTETEWSKFGVPLSEIEKFISHANSHGLRIKGLHFHTSWNRDPKNYVENLDRISKLGNVVEEIEFIDIGGGFFPEGNAILNRFTLRGDIYSLIKEETGEKLDFDPHSFKIREVTSLEGFAEDISTAFKRIRKRNPLIQLVLEPGRYIASKATTILLKVTSADKDCAVVDGGINMLGDYKFEEYSFAPIVNLTRPSTKLNRKVIYGPLCDPYDLWGYSYYGDGLRTGDILAVLHQGAYTFSRSWRFIKEIPAYIMMDGKNISVVKDKEDFAARYAGCKI